MKVGTDGVLLAGLAALDREGDRGLADAVRSGVPFVVELHQPPSTPPVRRILDIGCGSGVISIFEAFRFAQAEVDAVDIDETAVKQTSINISLLPEDVRCRVSLSHTPIQSFQAPDSSYDLIVCASPYFKTREDDPFVSDMKENRRLARHLHSLTLSDLIETVRRLLKPDGTFYTILPTGEPAEEFEKLIYAAEGGLTCEEIVIVRDNPSSKALRKMYICSLPSQHTQIGLQPTEMWELPVYAKSYKEEPITHRTYSDSYKHLLFSYCRHFPTGTIVIPPSCHSNEVEDK